MSAMRHTNNQVNCKSSVKSASVQQSGQRQVIGQTNVNPTSENHPSPKNRKNGERLTPIASDRPTEPIRADGAAGGDTASKTPCGEAEKIAKAVAIRPAKAAKYCANPNPWIIRSRSQGSFSGWFMLFMRHSPVLF